MKKLAAKCTTDEIRLPLVRTDPSSQKSPKGVGIEDLAQYLDDRQQAARKELEQLTGHEMMINIHEVLSPELCATLVAESIAQQLERRMSFRRVMKKAVQNTMRLGAKGIRLRVAGRLNGAEIARSENTAEGSVPLHTLRANIDYGVATAHTTYGCIGVKCWIYQGDMLPGERVTTVGGERPAGQAAPAQAQRRPSGERQGGERQGGGGGRGPRKRSEQE